MLKLEASVSCLWLFILYVIIIIVLRKIRICCKERKKEISYTVSKKGN